MTSAGGGARPLGGAAKWRLAKSLAAMEAELSARGARLDIVSGRRRASDPGVGRSRRTQAASYGRDVMKAAPTALDARVKAALRERGVEATSFNGRLLREPWKLARSDGAPIGVFSAFWRRHRALGPLPAPTPAPERLTAAPWPREAPQRVSIDALRLNAHGPALVGRTRLGEEPGETGALAALKTFAGEALRVYADQRDLLAPAATSHLSAHLRFGEISPRRVAHCRGNRCRRRIRQSPARRRNIGPSSAGATSPPPSSTPMPISQPGLCDAEFERFPWRDDKAGFRAWAHGETGYPIVDAGMRQLWRTGFMPNRVRMIAASFLVKHLLIDWRRGETWFWDTLIDADPASNPLNWQWVTGSGVDSAPYFRIFNPVLQAQKFDPDGAYVRRWVPELASSGAGHPCPLASVERSARARGNCVWQNLSRSPSSTTPSPAPARSRRSRRFGAAERPARDCIADPDIIFP